MIASLMGRTFLNNSALRYYRIFENFSLALNHWKKMGLNITSFRYSC